MSDLSFGICCKIELIYIWWHRVFSLRNRSLVFRLNFFRGPVTYLKSDKDFRSVTEWINPESGSRTAECRVTDKSTLESRKRTRFILYYEDNKRFMTKNDDTQIFAAKMKIYLYNGRQRQTFLYSNIFVLVACVQNRVQNSLIVLLMWQN